MTYEVTFSPDINQSDTIEFNGSNQLFELNKVNDTNSSLIVLYMYVLPKAGWHGIKVGMATCHINETFYHAIKKRIAEQEHELALSEDDFNKYGKVREVIYWGVCLDATNDSFKDYSVHKKIKLENAGLVEKEQEWFVNVSPDDLISIFKKVRERGLKKEIYTPRKEQQECIDALKAYFNKKPVGGRFLLNCKMRFGKSYTTYKFCEDTNLKKILILTFIPAVESSWKDDLTHIKTNYKYFTDKDLRIPLFQLYSVEDPYVLFLSLQNFLGKDKNSDIKEKIQKLKDEHFDLVILDEYHFGAWNKRTQEKFEDLNSEYQNALSKTKDVIDKFGIKTDKVICLSGTPFKAIARGEFTKENTYTYSYFDEQKNKYPNDDFDHPDPKYAYFPDMKIFGYNMSALFGNLTNQVFSDDKLLSKKYFSLNKFFETRRDDNPNEPIKFIYEEEIKKWLEIIKGRSTFGNKFPYSQIDMLEHNKHTLWLMPTVNSCIAMSKLLSNDEYFKKYEIINLSQDGVGSGVDAFDYLMEGINSANNTNKLGSIALTVNKLTIGVTVKEWFSVFVLKDLASPEQYFQSIFRIQTPFVKNEPYKILKKNAFVYDFNIDRASALLLRYAEETAEDNLTKLDIAKLIVKYLPIFMNGDMTHPIAYEVFYQLAQFGDKSNVPLSKKITDLSTTTHALDEDTMAKMLNDPEISPIFKKIFMHSKLEHSKDNRVLPPKPDDDGFESKIAKEARDKGYSLGMDDSKDYLDLDDTKVQSEFEKHILEYVKTYCPEDYDNVKKIWYENGFKKGYEKGVNVPIKKLNCGFEDGKKFAENKVKERFGKDITYSKNTRTMIENFVRPYLNDINNIPSKYRGMLYKRWYVESFLRGVKNTLTPVIKAEKDDVTIDDADNALRHILARVVEFLYISVYRETSFSEIFKNADPDVFLEAVGIKKEDFEKLNKYHIFEENSLNNYIHEFFVNESIGASLNLNDENIARQYRNSFDWFDFGLSNTESLNDESDSDCVVSNDMEEISQEAEDNKIVEPSIFERIVKLLKENPNGMKSINIANALGLSKHDVNFVLFNNDVFRKDILFKRRLK